MRKRPTFPQKPCHHCGVEHQPKWSGTSFCSVACQLAHHTTPGQNGCLVWTGGTAWRYGTIKINGKMRRAHRAAWEDAYGPIPKGLFVCHKCDNPPCINIDHLFLGTVRDNTADKLAKGRGTREGYTKLQPKSVLEIREKWCSGKATMKGLGREYGVHCSTIKAIILRQTFKYL